MTPPPLPSEPAPGTPLPASDSDLENHEPSTMELAFAGHTLNPRFVSEYELTEELGAGATGFVCSAKGLSDGTKVAVKFMYKDRIPVTNWLRDRQLGTVPLEAFILKRLNHPNIVKFLGFYEDTKFVYLVMESHGTPWNIRKDQLTPSVPPLATPGTPPTPPLATPPIPSTPTLQSEFYDSIQHSVPVPIKGFKPPHHASGFSTPLAYSSPTPAESPHSTPFGSAQSAPTFGSRPTHYRRRSRRVSQDLFECIDANPFLAEDKVKFIFKQIAEAVGYLHQNNVVHRDIKDENIVIADDMTIRLVDFGTAAYIPTTRATYFDMFYGTLRYAAPEILRNETYRGPEQDVWSLGVLLYTIAFSTAPFPDEEHVLSGRYVRPRFKRSRALVDLIEKMLVVDTGRRINIEGVLKHRWLCGEAELAEHEELEGTG
ncbi:hypothetical protein HDV00_000683 [Rhizophlyctis rosea]|nr:hypothetical protein HDV00_000683 [Rhizophlyctis rosea]